ncbi:MAG TPA: substrate-binding domain-containing protein [Armatimonadota bacterium]
MFDSTLQVSKRIEYALRADLQRGKWPLGAKLKGRRLLAAEYGVSLPTLEKAISVLLNEGILRTDLRSGTFVTRIPFEPTGTPKHVAEAVAPTATDTVGIIMKSGPQHANLWGNLIVEEAELALCAAGKRAVFLNTEASEPSLSIAQSADRLLADGVSGLIFVGIHDRLEEANEVLLAVDPRKTPTVYIAGDEIHQPIPCVFPDQRQAGYQATNHLLTRGHQQILYFSTLKPYWAYQRFIGIRQAVRDAGLSEDAVLLYPPLLERDITGEQREDFYPLVRAALHAGIVPSAVIAENDMVAEILWEEAVAFGRVPGIDFALIGFDNLFEDVGLGLTSMRYPLATIGQSAVQLLLRLQAGYTPETQIRLQLQLIPRASTENYRLPGE